MQTVSATRAALKKRRDRIELAEQGYQLLQEKEAALIDELLDVAEDVLPKTEEVSGSMRRARVALARANSIAGTESVRSAAMATQQNLPLDLGEKNVAGVTVPEFGEQRASRTPLNRGYGLTGTSTTIDEAAQAFEDVVDQLLQLAEGELRIRTLTQEIEKTSRRINALEHVVLPRLREEEEHIERQLQERERADRARLKLAKKLTRGG